jgi:hypothetical protein
MDIGTGSNIFDKVFPGWPTGVKSKAAKKTLNNTPHKKVGDAVALRKIWSTRFLTPSQKETWSEFIGQLPESSPPSVMSLSDLIIIGDERGSGNLSGFEIVLSSNGDGADEVHLGGGGHSESDEKHFDSSNDPSSRAFPGATGGEKDSGTTTPSTVASSLFEYAEVDDDNADTIVDGGEDLGNYHSGRDFSNDGAVSRLHICFQSENTDDKKNPPLQPRGKSTKTIAFKQPEISVTAVSSTIPDIPQVSDLLRGRDEDTKERRLETTAMLETVAMSCSSEAAEALADEVRTLRDENARLRVRAQHDSERIKELEGEVCALTSAAKLCCLSAKGSAAVSVDSIASTSFGSSVGSTSFMGSIDEMRFMESSVGTSIGALVGSSGSPPGSPVGSSVGASVASSVGYSTGSSAGLRDEEGDVIPRGSRSSRTRSGC